MQNASDTLDDSQVITPNDGVRVRVIFLTDYPDQPTFYIDPYGRTGGPTVVIET